MLTEEYVHITRPAAATALLLLLLAACDTAPATGPTQALDPALAANSAPLPDAGTPRLPPPATLPLGPTGPATPPPPAPSTTPPDPRGDTRPAGSPQPPRGSGTSGRVDRPPTRPDRVTSRPDAVDPWAACGFGVRFAGGKDDSPQARICRPNHG